MNDSRYDAGHVTAVRAWIKRSAHQAGGNASSRIDAEIATLNMLLIGCRENLSYVT